MSEKKTFYIRYTETNVGHWSIQASSKEEAYEKFMGAMNSGQIDYSELFQESSEYEVFSSKKAGFDDAIEVIIDEDEEDDNDEC